LRDYQLVDYYTLATILISLSALGVSVYAALSTHKRAKRTENITSKWEQIRIAREIFTTVFALENRLLDLGADERATKDQTEKDRIKRRAEAILITMAQHLDYFADLVLSNRIEWDVVPYYVTHLVRTSGEISMGLKLELFGPNLTKLLTQIAGLSGKSLDDLLGTKKSNYVLLVRMYHFLTNDIACDIGYLSGYRSLLYV
jgi:hypothetical protein